MAEGKIKIKLVRSPISTPQKHKNIVKSLGLHKINRVVERPDKSAAESQTHADHIGRRRDLGA